METTLATSMRVLLHGGDTMLGRAVQLTFPHQAPHEELIRDSTTAGDYLRMALHCNRWPQQLQLARILPPLDPQELALVRLANRDGSYLWGDYLNSIVIHPPPDVRVLNLETAITETIDNKDIPRKGINYHMHSANVPLVFQRFAGTTFASGPGEEDDRDGSEGITTSHHQHQQQSQLVNPSPYVISLANNHAMDFGRTAFERETLPALSRFPFRASGGGGGGAGGGTAIGAGMTFSDAARACSIDLPEKHARVKCIALATECAGTPENWSATATRSGMVVLPALTSARAVDEAFELTAKVLQENNIAQPQHQIDTEQKLSDSSDEASEVLVVLSIHWGPNWAYRSRVDLDYQRYRQMFAHRVVHQLGVDLIYGHSSHHIRGMEVYKRKLIVYGAGDLVNDYEGFANPGDEAYSTLGALFLVDLNIGSGDLDRVALIPTYMDRLQLKRAMGGGSLLRWSPVRQQMESVPNAIEELRDAVNRLSVMDVGDHGKPVVLRMVDNWRDVPGAPVLLYP